MIDVENIIELLESKTQNGFSGSVLVRFENGSIVGCEKRQKLNRKRVYREIARDRKVNNDGK